MTDIATATTYEPFMDMSMTPDAATAGAAAYMPTITVQYPPEPVTSIAFMTYGVIR
jgi:hypothetical protein